MTPEEQAKDIFVKHLEMIPDDVVKENHIAKDLAKLHATISINLILEVSPTLPIVGYGTTLLEDIQLSKKHYQEVKEEIQKL